MQKGCWINEISDAEVKLPNSNHPLTYSQIISESILSDDCTKIINLNSGECLVKSLKEPLISCSHMTFSTNKGVK